MRNILISLVGAAVGGVLGFFGFGWFLSYGFYALVLPGGLMGIGASAGRARSMPLAIVLSISAIVLSLVAEWKYRPFVKDDSLDYFVQHLHQLSPVTFLMIAVGAFVAFWGGYDPWGRLHGRGPGTSISRDST